MVHYSAHPKRDTAIESAKIALGGVVKDAHDWDLMEVKTE